MLKGVNFVYRNASRKAQPKPKPKVQENENEWANQELGDDLLPM